MRSVLLRGAVLLATMGGWGCAAAPQIFVPASDRAENLPTEWGELRALVDQLQEQPKASPHQLDRSLAALEHALRDSAGPPYEVSWRQARGASLLGRMLKDDRQRSAMIVRSLEAGRRAIQLHPGGIEGHYYLAVALAFEAEHSQDLDRIPPLVEQAARAVEVDDSYDNAGPLRLLGKIYLEAPEWPTSVGDKEEAVELLTRAVERAPTALNQYFLGEALFHDEQYEEAKRALRSALGQVGGEHLSAPWRSLATEYLEEIALAGAGGGGH